MSTLPYDYARCAGRISTSPTSFGTVSVGRAECVQCRRRTPGRPDGQQVYVVPPPLKDGKCPIRIEEQS